MYRNSNIIIFALMIFFIATGYSSKARLAGMGDMSFIFQDYFNKLDLYGFAGITAGFFRHDSISNVVFRGSFLSESWELDSLTYIAIGQAIPQKLIDYAPVEAVSFYDIIPQFDLVPCEIIYRSCRYKETYDYFGNLRKPQAWGVSLGYSQLQREFRDDEISDIIRTPSFGFIYSKSFFEKFDLGLAGDGFYGAYNSPDNEDKITLMPFGGGAGISYNTDAFAIGLNADYHYANFRYDGIFGSEKFSGHAIAPSFGSLLNLANFIWVSAFDYKWVDLNGTANSQDIGELEITGYSAKTQILFSPNFVRLAGYAGYDNKKPVYTDESDDTWFETKYSSLDFGGGCGIAMVRLNAGIEVLYRHLKTEDYLVWERAVSSNDIVLRGGIEFSFVDGLYIRGGYIYDTYDPDLDAPSSYKIKANTITVGCGLNFLTKTRIDIAYNYKRMKSDLMTGERVTDHIIYLFFNRELVEREF